ncbi:hypothetical protein QCA50_017354 [Cerrena zonata]|uniref:Uncharacterized protein n=1 Tax=Cerrena zonata TaxID=2478898 RepID=A0AAW0FHB1_9APHY
MARLVPVRLGSGLSGLSRCELTPCTEQRCGVGLEPQEVITSQYQHLQQPSQVTFTVKKSYTAVPDIVRERVVEARSVPCIVLDRNAFLMNHGLRHAVYMHASITETIHYTCPLTTIHYWNI